MEMRYWLSNKELLFTAYRASLLRGFFLLLREGGSQSFLPQSRREREIRRGFSRIMKLFFIFKMMQSFKSKKHHDRKWFILYYAKGIAGLLTGAVICYFLFEKKGIAFAIPIIPCALLIRNFIQHSRQLLINEVVVINNLVIFYVYNFWKGHSEKKTTIDKLKTELDTNYSEGLLRDSTTALFFFHHQPGTFYMTPEKDHFSKEMIINLAEALKAIHSQTMKPVELPA